MLSSFLQALARDIAAAAELIARFGLDCSDCICGRRHPHQSYPRKISPECFSLIVDAFSSPELQEFTVEAGRPDSMSDEKIAAMKEAGVSRVSVNPQTMQEKTLKLIGRRHTVHDIIEMLTKIRYSGIGSINMDIIVGLPGESELEMTDTMEQIAGLAPNNLTVHTLAIKKGSLLKQ